MSCGNKIVSNCFKYSDTAVYKSGRRWELCRHHSSSVTRTHSLTKVPLYQLLLVGYRFTHVGLGCAQVFVLFLSEYTLCTCSFTVG